MNQRIKSKKESKELFDQRLSFLLDKYSALNIDVENKSVEDLQKENLYLLEIAKHSLLYIRTMEIIDTEIPTGGGAPAIDENQNILEKAFNEFWEQFGEPPNEPQWLSWIEKDEYKPIKNYIVAANTKFARTKNGWGKEKVRKDLAKFKSTEFQLRKLLEKIHGTK
jgi:hypothetical protein